MAEVEDAGHTADMAPGRTSQYDVFVDDELVFSKQREHRFPEPSEILSAL